MSLTPAEQRRRNCERAKRYYRDNREKVLATVRKWRIDNPKQFERNQRRWTANAGNRRRAESKIKRKEDAAGRRRPDRCEVCGGEGPIVFDHCHRRGVFRGWLCNGCNTVLGHVGDDPDRLRKLIAYLERTASLIPPQLTLPGL